MSKFCHADMGLRRECILPKEINTIKIMAAVIAKREGVVQNGKISPFESSR